MNPAQEFGRFVGYILILGAYVFQIMGIIHMFGGLKHISKATKIRIAVGSSVFVLIYVAMIW